jgi:hypothetical protein
LRLALEDFKKKSAAAHYKPSRSFLSRLGALGGIYHVETFGPDAPS